MTVELNARAKITVDNSAALAALRETSAAVNNLGHAVGKAGKDATSAAPPLDAVADAAASITPAATAAANATTAVQAAMTTAKPSLDAAGAAAAGMAASVGRAGASAAAAAAPVHRAAAAANDLAPAASRGAAATGALRASLAASVAASQANTAAISALTAQLIALEARMTATSAASVGAAGKLGGAGRAAGSAGAALSGFGRIVGMAGGVLGSFAGAAIGSVIGGLVNMALAGDGAGASALSLAGRYGEAGSRIDRTFTAPLARAFKWLKESAKEDMRRLADGAVHDLNRMAQAVEWFREKVGMAPMRAADDVIRAPRSWMDRLQSGVQLGTSRTTAEIEAAALERYNSALTNATGITARYAAAVRDLRSERDAGQLAERQYEQQFLALTRQRDADLERLRQSEAAARDATQRGKRAAAEAARQAKRDLEEQIKLTKELAQARSIWMSKLPSASKVWEQQDKAEAERLRARDNDLLSQAVKKIDEDRDVARATDQMGRDIAAAAARELEMRAIDIGGLLGGQAGAALGAVVAGMRSGDFRSLGGPLGGTLQGISNAYQERGSLFRDAMKPMVDSFNQVFGGRPFAQTLGSAFQGAGVGSQLGSLFGASRNAQIGATLGGAMGQVAGEVVGKTIGKTLGSAAGPLGAIAGSLLGGALGGLFGGSKPKGSVTLTGVGGEVNVGAATGTGGSQKSNSTRAANSISSALTQIADQLGGEIGQFSVSIGMSGGKYRVDTAGLGRTNKKNSGVTGYGQDAAAAVQAALADAIQDGAITGVSPRVQSALRKYADDIDRAVAEAMKVQGLEDLLADRQNPFTSIFRDFERQARERLKIAERYGFDILEIEALNAEQRKKLLEDQLASVAQSARSLLDDLRYGSRAEGSIVDRLAAMGSERARLQSLVDGGDSSQIDALTRIIEQQLDLTREAYGSTSPFAEERSASMTALDAIIRQTEARINEASAAAQAQQNTNAQLAEANTTLDEQTVLLQQIRDNLAKMGSGAGGISFDPSSFSWQHLL